jgi:sugar (pentulose or hexulose) kinase
MKPDLILVLDAGTTSTRAIAFTQGGEIVASAGRPITQHTHNRGGSSMTRVKSGAPVAIA